MPALRCISSAARPATPKPDPEPRLFFTPNTNLGAYFIATNRLRYCGSKMAIDHDGVEFLFDDPDGVGTQLKRSFKTGNADPGNPRALSEARRFLKSEVKRVRAGVANANTSR
jgi:hypothetical protein